MNKLSIHITLFFTLLFSLSVSACIEDTFKLVTTKTEFTAGEKVIIEFTTDSDTSPLLYVSNSFGETILKASKSSNILQYEVPISISSRTGIISWRLLTKTEQLQGNIKIKSQQKIDNIQTYLGPPSIAAGGKDYSMLVAIPTDAYDNPLADSTLVTVKHQFQNNQITDSVFIKKSISYKNIYSPIKTGRILLSSSSLGFNSKEYDINLMPAPPTNFSIGFNRHHEFADGNQITTFSTSIIKDAFSNIISDGTYVEFFIKTSKNTILKTSGATINGVARAKMVHPDHEDSWVVQAFIEGMAESNRIDINYKSVISDFNIEFLNDNREITVGPLKSFMNQMIPDGLEVTLHIYSENKLMITKRKSSADGYANFKLNTNQFPKGSYSILVKAAGITKSVGNIKL